MTTEIPSLAENWGLVVLRALVGCGLDSLDVEITNWKKYTDTDTDAEVCSVAYIHIEKENFCLEFRPEANLSNCYGCFFVFYFCFSGFNMKRETRFFFLFFRFRSRWCRVSCLKSDALPTCKCWKSHKAGYSTHSFIAPGSSSVLGRSVDFPRFTFASRFCALRPGHNVSHVWHILRIMNVASIAGGLAEWLEINGLSFANVDNAVDRS